MHLAICPAPITAAERLRMIKQGEFCCKLQTTPGLVRPVREEEVELEMSFGLLAVVTEDTA